MSGVGLLAVIPSPTQSVWYLGPLPIRAYALCILTGIIVAVVMTRRRWAERGGDPDVVLDVATWAVPFGVIGGRLYHVITWPGAYFGPEGDLVRALYVWEGGLGIWGAVVLGGVGAWIGCRRAGVKLPPFADTVAPGLVLAQGIGRWGNWFNNELYGQATTLPWAMEVHAWDSSAGQAIRDAAGNPVVLGTFHPTFLYEALWNVAVAAVLIHLGRRFMFGHGRLFALYALLYSLGRIWIEMLRVDPSERVLGLRLNVWTCLLVILGAALYLVISASLRPGRETELRRTPGAPPPPADEGEPGVTPQAEPASVAEADGEERAGSDAGPGPPAAAGSSGKNEVS